MTTPPPRLLRVETVGDLPVLWACLQRLRLVPLLEQHFPADDSVVGVRHFAAAGREERQSNSSSTQKRFSARRQKIHFADRMRSAVSARSRRRLAPTLRRSHSRPHRARESDRDSVAVREGAPASDAGNDANSRNADPVSPAPHAHDGMFRSTRAAHARPRLPGARQWSPMRWCS